MISFMGNTLKAILSFVTGILLARGLGPELYGVFSFLLASFIAMVALLEMGTSSAFFTFISQRNRSKIFFAYYLGWLLIQFIIIILFIAVLAPDQWVEQIWKNQSRQLVLTAFIAVFLQQQIWTLIAQVGESQRLTSRVQLINCSIALVHLILIASLFLYEQLTLSRIYFFISMEFVIAFIVGYKLLPIIYAENKEAFQEIVSEYWKYCLPLIPFAWVSMVMRFVDTWLLQHFGGSVEQAYYAVSSQFATISLIATASVLRILWKEVADAQEKGHMDQVREIYHRTSRILFFLAAIISGFLIPWTPDIIRLFLGEEYIQGSFVMALMFLYPIHQSLGQVNGTMFYALQLTKPYVKIGIVFMIVSIIVVYFMLASPDSLIPGLGLASTGLALKMVLLQFIGVNFSIWWLSRRQEWNYQILYQIIGLLMFLLTGYLIYIFTNTIFNEELHIIFQMLFAGIIYIFSSILILYSFPNFLLGMKRMEINNYVVKFFLFIKKIKA